MPIAFRNGFTLSLHQPALIVELEVTEERGRYNMSLSEACKARLSPCRSSVITTEEDACGRVKKEI